MGSIHEKITGLFGFFSKIAGIFMLYSILGCAKHFIFLRLAKRTHRHEGEIGHVFNLKIKPLFQACRQAGKFICKLKRICIFS